jgi:hypothetical protein
MPKDKFTTTEHIRIKPPPKPSSGKEKPSVPPKKDK